MNMSKEPTIATTGKCKRLIVTLLTLLLIIPGVAMAKGKYKPGKYDERYEIPFSRLSWRGKTYKKGTCEIWVDLWRALDKQALVSHGSGSPRTGTALEYL